MDNTDYLQEGFDPSTLRVADLRRVFVFHDIDYPSSAKKADLVRIFKENITPRAGELLREVQTTEPNGQRIVDVAPSRRTRSVSPSKAKATKRSTSPTKAQSPSKVTKEPASPRKPRSPTKTRTSPRKKKVEEEEEEKPKIVEEPELKPPVLEDAPQLKPELVSPQKRRGKRTLTAKAFVEPTEANIEEPKKAVPVAPLAPVGTTPRTKPNKEEGVPSSASFSDKNVFQSGSPAGSPKELKASKKRPHSKDEDAGAAKKSRKSNVGENMPEPQGMRTPVPKPVKEPSSVASNSSTRATPGSAIRHFTSFPSTPDDAQYGTPDHPGQSFVPMTVQPKAASKPESVNDFTFQSEQRVNKRLSFMPTLDQLKMSNQFSQQLRQEQEAAHTMTPLQKSIGPSSIMSPLIEGNSTLFSSPLSAADADLPITSVTSESILSQKNEDTQEQQTITEKVEKLKEEIDREEAAASLKEEKKGASAAQFWLQRIFSFALFGLLAAYAGWWREQRIEVGYCDVGFSSADDDYAYGDQPILEQVVEALRPKCVPCPSHATCYPDFKAVCDVDFVQVPHPLSFNGLIPIAPKCVADTEKQQRVYIMSQRIADILRDRNAAAYCGETSEPAGIDADDLRGSLYDIKAPELSDEEFDDLWKHAIKDIKDNDEFIVERVRKSTRGYAKEGDTAPNFTHTTSIIQSTSLAKISLQCRIRKTVTGSLVRYRRRIAGAVIGLAALAGVWQLLQIRKSRKERARQLAQDVLARLAKQQRLSDEDTKGITVSYLASHQLRDLILVDENEKAKEKLWDSVTRVIETNTNVRVRQLESHGEIMRTWEWVGSDL
ncbi:inner nuclear membrane protein Src1p [Trichomonascus vanleenenianus]|uniref:inner nuclear membrane protein Src1p n=1 Tax=Trichomonascus vanleenenianus TaxID=2268995 RepID=UPI003ECA8F49